MKKVEVVYEWLNTRTFERIGNIRKEIIDVENHKVFGWCKTHADIRNRYESYWNVADEKKGMGLKLFVQSVETIEK